MLLKANKQRKGGLIIQPDVKQRAITTTMLILASYFSYL